MPYTSRHTREGLRRVLLFSGLLVALMATASCNESDDDGPAPEPKTVTSLDITVTGDKVQAPFGNMYLFYSEDADLNYAVGREADRSLMPDGSKAPLIDVSRPFNPVIRYEHGGRQAELHPVSAYGTSSDGSLDTHSSVRYSQMHFSIPQLSAEYGKIGKGSLVLVVIILNDEVSHTWVSHPLELRRNYTVHVALPDHKAQTYVASSDLGFKWWQVEGEE